ncbi:hypothetical protein JCM8097_000335 [Rhodosporidiobolus ruineniae]
MSHSTEKHTLEVEGDIVKEYGPDGQLVGEKDYTRTVHGYERAAQNKHTSADKREEDLRVVDDLKAMHDDNADIECEVTKPATRHFDSDAKHARKHDETHEQEVHRHRQIGSFKAVLHRDGSSKEAKQHAREELKKLGEHVEEE